MMDRQTLQALVLEAKKNHQRASKKFEKNDNVDDMHDMQHWAETVMWLEEKLLTQR